MRAVVQRVKKAGVSVDGCVIGAIDAGLVVLLGVEQGDTQKDAYYLADKIVQLRIFEDAQGKMNESLLDKAASLLVVSQFTLLGDCRKGRRPGFDKSARPEAARMLYEMFVEYCRNEHQVVVETGRFQTEMLVSLENDGPVTILVDSRKNF